MTKATIAHVLLAAGPRSIRPTTTYRGHRPENSLHHVNKFSRVSCVQFPLDCGGFEVALNEWEHLVQRWEVLANDILNDAVKRQILLDMAPAGIRVQLTLAGHSSYEALRSAIMSYLVAHEIGMRQPIPQTPLQHQWRWTP